MYVGKTRKAASFLCSRNTVHLLSIRCKAIHRSVGKGNLYKAALSVLITRWAGQAVGVRANGRWIHHDSSHHRNVLSAVVSVVYSTVGISSM